MRKEVSLDAVNRATGRLVSALLAEDRVKPGGLLVAGVSTSEVVGEQIGTATNMEVAEAIFTTMMAACRSASAFLAVQGCEHINRAVLVEREYAQQHGGEQVNVLPWERAGGAFAAFAYRHFRDPVMLKTVQADAGIDIGLTLIGMQIRPVAVPVRPADPYIGAARVVLAYSRLPLIGGERAKHI